MNIKQFLETMIHLNDIAMIIALFLWGFIFITSDPKIIVENFWKVLFGVLLMSSSIRLLSLKKGLRNVKYKEQ